MKPKGKKKEELDALKKDLEQATNLFVAQFQGMTVLQDTELRQKIRETKSKYRVVKNTLAKKAAEGTPAEGVAKSMVEDPRSLASRVELATATLKAMGLDPGKSGELGCLAQSH